MPAPLWLEEEPPLMFFLERVKVREEEGNKGRLNSHEAGWIMADDTKRGSGWPHGL